MCTSIVLVSAPTLIALMLHINCQQADKVAIDATTSNKGRSGQLQRNVPDSPLPICADTA